MRQRALAAAAVLTTALLAGCSQAPPPAPPEVIPTTLAPKPTVSPQPKAEIQASTPRLLLQGAGRSSALQMWQQTQDFVRDWMLNPDYMQKQHVTSVEALDGITALMTTSAAARWKKDAHAALAPYLAPTPDSWKQRPTLEFPVNQLITWNVALRQDRGWDNPMLTPVIMKGGAVITTGNLIAVITPVETGYRLMGQGREYLIPTTSAIGLTWRREGGSWKLDSWWRVYRLDAESVLDWKPGQPAPRDSDPATAAQPTTETTVAPGEPTVDPTLAPD